MLIFSAGQHITRFPTARRLCAWAGLTPAVRNSDRKVRHGHITKQGSVWVRWILTEAAQRAKRDPAFAASYAAIAHRRGRGIATVAIVHKLLARAFHLLTEHADTTTGDRSSQQNPKPQPPPGDHTDQDPAEDREDGQRHRARSQNRMSPQHGR